MSWNQRSPVIAVSPLSGHELDLGYSVAWRPPGRSLSRFLKRFGDLSVALLLVIVLSPLLALLAVLIRRRSPGSPLVVEERLGCDPRTAKTHSFGMLRFRSEFPPADGGPAPEGGTPDRLGPFLRRTSLDDLPQLFNVLAGEMSLVGPRPVLPAEAADYEHRHRRRFTARPGITGWWQIGGRNRVSREEAIRMDLQYVERGGLAMDLMILLLTPFVVLLGRGLL